MSHSTVVGSFHLKILLQVFVTSDALRMLGVGGGWGGGGCQMSSSAIKSATFLVDLAGEGTESCLGGGEVVPHRLGNVCGSPQHSEDRTPGGCRENAQRTP